MGLGGVVLGAAITGITNAVANSRRMRFELDKLNGDRERADSETIIAVVLEVRAESSLTASSILEDQKASRLVIHERYLRLAQKIREALVAARLSKNSCVDDLNALSGLTNQIWGKQQNYFGSSKDNEGAKEALRLELIGLFEKSSDLCTKILDAIW
jgi:hypothetical protein